MPLVEVKQVPVGTPSPSYGSFVAATHQVLHQLPGLVHQVTPTATILMGDLDHCLEAVRQMHRLGFQFGAPRVVTSVMIDERVDKPMSPGDMVAEVEQGVPGYAGAAPVYTGMAAPLPAPGGVWQPAWVGAPAPSPLPPPAPSPWGTGPAGPWPWLSA